MAMNTHNIISPNAITPFERIFPISKINNLYIWIFLSTVSIFYSIISFQYSKIPLLILLPLGIGIAIIPIFVKIGATIIWNWKDSASHFILDPNNELDLYYKNKFDNFSRIKKSYLIFLILAIFSIVLIYYSAGAFNELTLFEKSICWSIFSIAVFICGIGALSIYHLFSFFWGIGKFKVIIESHQFGVMSSGQKLFSCYLMGCIVWFLYSITGLEILEISALAMYTLSLPSFVILILSFVGAQIPLHRRMLEFKKERLENLQSIIKIHFPQNQQTVSKEQLELLKQLNELSSDAQNLPNWPFNLKTFIGVVGGALGAISPTILSFVFEYWMRGNFS